MSFLGQRVKLSARSLLNNVLPTVEEDDVWIGERNFWTLNFFIAAYRPIERAEQELHIDSILIK
jgi:hypothetical protein